MLIKSPLCFVFVSTFRDMIFVFSVWIFRNTFKNCDSKPKDDFHFNLIRKESHWEKIDIFLSSEFIRVFISTRFISEVFFARLLLSTGFGHVNVRIIQFETLCRVHFVVSLRFKETGIKIMLKVTIKIVFE